MPAKPVQVSIDIELLSRIDSDPEARSQGRSAFLRSAATYYLAAKARRKLDDELFRAYDGQADEMASEIAEFMDGQAWPET